VTNTLTHRRDLHSRATLKQRLDALYGSFNRVDSATDPIQIVRRFSYPADREVVAFCAAALAFGRVTTVLQSIERLLVLMGPSPAAFVREFNPRRRGATFKPLVHRWTRGEDLVALLVILKHMLASGSIEAFFLEGYDSAAIDVSEALESFSSRALAVDQRDAYGDRTCHPGVAYFFPRPSSGSGCKRLNLFLRWMVRKDAVDFGLWSKVRPARLIVPLDTHVIRVGRCLRLTRYASPGWKMAADVTASLRALDPEDPVKYDFSLCHIGMADLCGFNRAQGDASCPLRGLCHPDSRGGPRRVSDKPRASVRPSDRR
jgi:uncharacterized protein (TIGR02757 family)